MHEAAVEDEVLGRGTAVVPLVSPRREDELEVQLALALFAWVPLGTALGLDLCDDDVRARWLLVSAKLVQLAELHVLDGRIRFVLVLSLELESAGHVAADLVAGRRGRERFWWWAGCGNLSERA